MAILIHDAVELQAIAADPTADYELANNIDATISATWDGGKGWTPIAADFTGSLDGKGFRIKNLYCNRPLEVFASMFNTNRGIIKDIIFDSINFTSQRTSTIADDNIGTIQNIKFWFPRIIGSGDSSGIADTNDGVITGCRIFGGQITATGAASGICDSNYGTISDCIASGLCKIAAGSTDYASGICDSNDNLITNCHSNVILSAGRDVSGICDTINIAGAIIERCSSYGSYNGGRFATGICDTSYGIVRNCFSKATIKAVQYATGVVRDNAVSHMIADPYVNNCYFAGVLNGANNWGVTADTDPLSATRVFNCVWDTDISGTLVSEGGTGKTEAEMRAWLAYSAWDFLTPIWYLVENSNLQYPALQRKVPMPG